MTDTDRDPHPDSPPESDHDGRSDIERAVGGRNEDVETLGETTSTSPLDPVVSPDTAGGSGGAVRNQDDDAQ